jgi:hypothetical protein
MTEPEKKTQCCERDLDHDGYCDVHPEVVRTEVHVKVNPDAKPDKKD